MTVSVVGDVFETQLWPQGDARDPLGVWGGRVAATGDASGGAITCTFSQRASVRGAYVYCCYATTQVQNSGALADLVSVSCRLLCGWPNVDAQVGVQAFSPVRMGGASGIIDFVGPIRAPNQNLVDGNLRFIPLFPGWVPSVARSLVEMQLAPNVLANVYSFECYGYYWDRAVMNTPGGLRHPGSS